MIARLGAVALTTVGLLGGMSGMSPAAQAAPHEIQPAFIYTVSTANLTADATSAVPERDRALTTDEGYMLAVSIHEAGVLRVTAKMCDGCAMKQVLKTTVTGSTGVVKVWFPVTAIGFQVTLKEHSATSTSGFFRLFG